MVGINPWVGKIPWRRAWQPTLVFLPGESHGQRNLVGCSPLGCRVRHDCAGSLSLLGFFSSCSEQGLSLVVVLRLLTVGASPIVGHGF